VVLLAVATALAVFTVDSYAVAARNRVERARVEIGADRVLHVAQTTPARLAAAVRSADPDGTRAMAALTSGSASNPTGPMVAVDAARLAAVGQWQRRWWSEPPAALLTSLRPKTAPSVVLHDAVVVHLSATGLSADAHLQLELDLRDPQGARLLAQLGTLLDGPHDYRAALPTCRLGCRLATIHFANPTPNQNALGTVVMERITDSAGVVDAGLTTRNRWRSAPGSRRDFGVLPATRVTPGPGGLTIEISGRPTDDAAVDVADRPAEVPALLGPDVDVRRTGIPARTAPAIGLDGSSLLLHPLPVARVLPRVFRDGLIVDLDTVDRADVSAPLGADFQVWLSPSAGPDVVAALRAAGLVVQRVEVRSDRLAELDRDGVSLALRLFLVATLAAVVLAIAAVASSVYVGARRREFELAAVRTLGASRRVLVGAARTEQLALLGLGVVLGLVTSLIAARWALPAIPPLGTGTSGVPPRFAPAWAEVAALTAGVVLISIVTADLLARAVVRAAGADRLREGAQ
jgi:hypothetical protein